MFAKRGSNIMVGIRKTREAIIPNMIGKNIELGELVVDSPDMVDSQKINTRCLEPGYSGCLLERAVE